MITPSQVEAISFAALDKKTAAERADYLARACGDDAEQDVRLFSRAPRISISS